MTDKKQLNENWEDERGLRALDNVMNNWSTGPVICPPGVGCVGDYNGDGQVDIDDLLWVLANWPQDASDDPGPEPLSVSNPNLGVDNAHSKDGLDKKPKMTPYGESWLPNTNKRILLDTWKENLEKSVNEGSFESNQPSTDTQLTEALMVLKEKRSNQPTRTVPLSVPSDPTPTKYDDDGNPIIVPGDDRYDPGNTTE
jgi:hypothetical protein